MIKHLSFKSKLIFSYILIILLSFIVIAYFLDKNLEKNSLQDIKHSLINEANLIECQIIPENLKKEDLAYLDVLVKSLGPKIKSRITIINNQGKVLADSEEPREKVLKMENHLTRPEVKAALSGDTGIASRYSSTLKINMLYVAIPLKDNNETIGILRVALPLLNVQNALFVVRKTVFFSLFFALTLALILGTVVTNSIIKPVNKIIYASRKFSKGDFTHKIILDSKDEIGELADTLNNMAQSLEDKIREVEIKNQHLVAILESMVEGIIVVDKTSRILSVNPTVEKIFSITKLGSEGKLLLETIRDNNIAEIASNVIERGKFISRELSLVWPVHRIFQIDASPVFRGNSVTGCLLVIHDITELRRLENMRRDFVANVSHELKTPLTSIKGFVETLLEGALEDKENSGHFLKIIQDHANRLDNLVNDLLDLSYLESSSAVLKTEKTNLKKLTEDILSGFRSQLKKKSVEAKNELPDDLSVKSDKNKIGQVLTNLIDNAIKFNCEKGTVRIYSERMNNKVKIIVEDSGIGVPQKDLARIFERFYRVDKARSRELGGTGLGLSIVKHIVELHSGEVGVESTEGIGSKFWFTLPI
jgi:two-component system phosphate regulon sensor histidine kinase PhoR